jgi:hypothetical protein
MPGRVAPAPDTVPKAIWVFLMENAQWVAVTVTIAVLIVVIVPPMIGTQRTARDVVAQSCAGALQSELAAGEVPQDLQALLRRQEVHTACADPALHIIPLPQPSTYAVQNTNGKHTYVITPTSLTRTP